MRGPSSRPLDPLSFGPGHKWTRTGPGWVQAGSRFRTETRLDSVKVQARGRDQAQTIRFLRQSWKIAVWKSNNPFLCKCVAVSVLMTCLTLPEMPITTRTTSQFCAERRAAEHSNLFVELISMVTIGSTDPWLECQHKEFQSIRMLLDGKGCRV